MSKQQRLIHRIAEETKLWKQLSHKLAKLKFSRNIETRPEEKYRLDSLIANDEQARQGIDSRLDALESKLESLSQTEYRTCPAELFYSYAHEDEDLLGKLEKYLAQMKRDGLIKTWYDRKLVPGSEWDQSISDRLNRADMILLMVSPDFLASDYIQSRELKIAMQRHERDEAVVIPVILRPIDLNDTSFYGLQALPANAKAVTLWDNIDQAFVSIAKGIKLVAQALNRNHVPL